MAKSISPSKNRTFQTSFFSDSEIDVAIQLIHLSEDSDYHDHLTASPTTSSDHKSLPSATNAAPMEDDGIHTSRRLATAPPTTSLIEQIFEEIGDGSNRRGRKRRSRSVYEIYKLTKPVISVK
ncbi:unnamed protein product [Citrullus colocynthis]|uniref:Uncharacterized protein n=1 Tax=Citrullus colocynthis TaxID=252529 RepID=A0ABP0XM91_9ROSI